MKTFVFLDDASRPYMVTEWGGTPWLFYLHADGKSWVSWRRVKPTEVEYMQGRALPPEQAALYPGLK